MKRKLLLSIIGILAAIGLSGCAKKGDNIIYSKYCDMEILECIDDNTYIIQDRDTGVLYLCDFSCNGGGYSPLYNADGSLKNIKDYEKE